MAPVLLGDCGELVITAVGPGGTVECGTNGTGPAGGAGSGEVLQQRVPAAELGAAIDVELEKTVTIGKYIIHRTTFLSQTQARPPAYPLMLEFAF